MTHGTIAGILIPDLIAGRENPWSQIYDPSRKPTRAPGEYVKENLNTAAQYRDWLTPGEVKSLEEIPKDSGATMRRGLVQGREFIGTRKAASTSSRLPARTCSAS
jgi:hypothetical protein